MLSMNDLGPGSLIMVDGAPYQILEIAHQHIGRGGSSTTAKIRNVKTGQVYTRTYKPSDAFAEADVEKRTVKFLYHHRGEFVFQDPKDAKNRFPLPEDVIGESEKWLKPNMELTVLFLEETPLNIQLPIKMDLKVTEAPPGVMGDRAQGGTKGVVVETGATIQVPLFINEDDIIRVNTETGEYVERVEKA